MHAYVRSAVSGLFAAIAATGAAVTWGDTLSYNLNPGSKYTFHAGLSGPIPGGEPSPQALDFHLAGTVTIAFDDTLGRAAITGGNFTVTGNEAVRDQLPAVFGIPFPLESEQVLQLLTRYTPLESDRTAERVQYLERFAFGTFTIDRFADGRLNIAGGADSTPVDGPAWLFDVTGIAVPELSSIQLALLFAVVAAVVHRRQSRRARLGGCRGNSTTARPSTARR